MYPFGYNKQMDTTAVVASVGLEYDACPDPRGQSQDFPVLKDGINRLVYALPCLCSDPIIPPM